MLRASRLGQRVVNSMPKRAVASVTQVQSSPSTKRTRSVSKKVDSEDVKPPSSPKKEVNADESSPAEKENSSTTKHARAKKTKDTDECKSPAAPSGKDHFAPEWVPRNKDIPAGDLHFARPAKDHIRIAIWNITSLKSSDKKGLMKYLKAEEPDVLVISETKVNEPPAHPGLDSMYAHQYWGIGEKKGYAGIAILSKTKPVDIQYGLPGFQDASSKARMITIQFPHTVIVGTYAVNAGDQLKTLSNKMQWNDALEKHLLNYQEKDVIWCGDLNVVWDDRDLADASKKWNKSAGYTQAECDAHRRVLAATQMQDAWRVLHPDAVGEYTFYGWRGNCRARGSGWRIDSFIASPGAMKRIAACEIRHAIYGPSDHLPMRN
ncbi:DNA-(apurinic or apyrimidinic site) lyase [Malassezia psittaci]|uniref:DNA-(apurinic or apyrimidinic site) endonuclease n=1 Tax=Malassezia psittaci TaxID=1821823 RepID=A0AAF0F6T9_9BASI|nr:DNA-(apurinic or apyrimidinic site) lyase [Malassezia psittaci]